MAMSLYLITAVHLTNGVIDEVDLLDYEAKKLSLEEPNRLATVKEVVDLIKAGHDVRSLWNDLPVLGAPERRMQGTIPVQVVTLPDGSESFEVVLRDQPELYRTVLNMDVYDQHWSRVGLFGPHGTRAGVARVAQEKENLEQEKKNLENGNDPSGSRAK